MPKIKFTDKKVKSLKTTKRMEDFWDQDFKDGSFGIRVFQTGKKSFTLIYRNKASEQKRVTLGGYPSLSVADARQKAKKLMQDVVEGKDPSSEKRTFRNSETFSELCDLFIELYPKIKQLRPKTIKEYSRIIEADLKPKLGRLKIASVSRKHIIKLIEDKAFKEESPTLANRIKALIHLIFQFAIQRELATGNPCAGLPSMTQAQSRNRFLTDEEIKQYWEYLDKEEHTVSSLFKLLMLTGQRSGEVKQMQWEHINLDSKTWEIPTELSKNKKTHLVPLCDLAIKELDKQKSTTNGSCFVFPSNRTGKPFGFLKQPCNRIASEVGEHFTPHDIRRTVATHMAKLGIQRHVLSKFLNHTSTESSITDVYDRHNYWKERVEAIEKWETKLRGIING